MFVNLHPTASARASQDLQEASIMEHVQVGQDSKLVLKAVTAFPAWHYPLLLCVSCCLTGKDAGLELCNLCLFGGYSYFSSGSDACAFLLMDGGGY